MNNFIPSTLITPLIIGGVILGILLFLDIALKGTKKSKRKGRGRSIFDMWKPENQIAAIAKVRFERVPIVNKPEMRVLVALEQIVAELGTGHRVMAQTSLGELLRVTKASGNEQDRKDAFASINSKRLDFALISPAGHIDLAVEYQGKGHHQGKAFARDAVKKEALRRAGVPLLEVNAGGKPSVMRAQLKDLLGVVGQGEETAD